ncbi:hypothetical protein J4208_02030 [Candidatus Woesearchaeota archaeon]|nr:hypothetical protein [Candidatus Woesearchaeota archaeon]
MNNNDPYQSKRKNLKALPQIKEYLIFPYQGSGAVFVGPDFDDDLLRSLKKKSPEYQEKEVQDRGCQERIPLTRLE